MTREQQKQWIKDQMAVIDILLSDVQAEQFCRYYEMLVEKNKVMNLTAITEFEDVVQKHFVDSVILPKRFAENPEHIALIDVGTGAGFPGIPLKIVYPEMKVVLLDSLNKRILFLRDVIQELHLENIQGVHARAEDGARNPLYREKFQLCVSRAVANLSILSEYCLPFLAVGGTFVSYKSGDIDEELAKAEKGIACLGGAVKEKIGFSLPESSISRSFIVIKKEKKTGKQYPRKAGLPAKQPL